jgi:hypothetical protein
VWLDDEKEKDQQYVKLQGLIMGLKLEMHKEVLLAMLRECRKIEKPERKAEILDKISRTTQKLREDELSTGTAMPPLIVWKERARGMELAKADYDKTGMEQEGQVVK